MTDRQGVSSSLFGVLSSILDRLHKLETNLGNRSALVPTDTAPILAATITNPVLGSGGVTGAEATDDGWISGNGTIRFGVSGASAGNGTYRLSLPASPAPLFTNAAHRVVGHGLAWHSGNIIDLFELMWNPAFGAYAELWSSKSPGNPPYTSSNPWAWVAGDYISYTVLYPRA